MNSTKLIKEKGYRLTKPREEILKVLESYPLTAQEIHNALVLKHISVDLASVYRSLELFVDMGIVHAIELGENKRRYELVDEKNHHHHLICNSCGNIEDISVDEKKLLTEVDKKSKFKIDHHHLEFFGTCSRCQ